MEPRIIYKYEIGSDLMPDSMEDLLDLLDKQGYIILPDSEIPLLPLEEEIKYLELQADLEAEECYYEDFLEDELRWYNDARQRGLE